MKIIFGAGKELVKRIALDNDHHGQCRVAPKSRSNAEGHVWTVPAVQEESDYQRSVRVRSCIRICCRLEGYLCRDAAGMAAGPDVIR